MTFKVQQSLTNALLPFPPLPSLVAATYSPSCMLSSSAFQRPTDPTWGEGGKKEDESSNRAILEKRRRKKDCLSKQIAPPVLLLKGEEALLPPPFLSQSERRCDLRRTCPPSLPLSPSPLLFLSMQRE